MIGQKILGSSPSLVDGIALLMRRSINSHVGSNPADPIFKNMKNIKIVFLDIDGVICLRSSRYLYFDVNCVNRLQKIISSTDSYIVISSAWRSGTSVKELQDIFSKNGDMHGVYHGPIPYFDTTRIIDKTGSFNMVRKHEDDLWGRGYEIDQWLKKPKNYKVSKYIILDDEVSDLGFYERLCVKTKTATGLTKEIAKKVINRLK